MNEYNSPLWKPKTQHISKPCPKESGLPSTSTKQSSELMSQNEAHNQHQKQSNLDP